jgi:hypothetical protein
MSSWPDFWSPTVHKKTDITIKAGTDFQLQVTYKNPDGSPVNLTGFSARMMVKRDYSDATPLVSLTTVDSTQGLLTLGGAAGTIDIWIKNAHTTTLAKGTGVYDLEIVSGSGLVTRLLEGSVEITPEVTK